MGAIINQNTQNVQSAQNGKKLIIVIHCKKEDSQHAIDQTKVAVDNGADGIFLIHHGGSHFGGNQDKLINIYEKVRGAFPNLYIGMNFLGLSAYQAYQAIPDTCQALWTDDGIDGNGVDEGIQKLKDLKPWKCQIFAGLAFKYRAPMDSNSQFNLDNCGELVNEMLDVTTTSGPGTGMAAELNKVVKIKQMITPGKQMALASGVNAENVVACLPYVDFFVVASSVETFSMSGILVPQKVNQLAQIVHNYKHTGQKDQIIHEDQKDDL